MLRVAPLLEEAAKGCLENNHDSVRDMYLSCGVPGLRIFIIVICCYVIHMLLDYILRKLFDSKWLISLALIPLLFPIAEVLLACFIIVLELYYNPLYCPMIIRDFFLDS